MSPGDLKTLHKPLAALVAVLALGAALVWYTHQQLVAAKATTARAEAALREATLRLQRSGDEKGLIERHLGTYEALERAGFVGAEQRINWVQALRDANQQASLFGVEYQIAPQQPYPYAAEFNPGGLTLQQSVMKTSFRLLHEGDLMRFLDALAQQRAGLFTINQCLLQRAGTSTAIRYQPNLRAECDLAWITARPAAPEKKP